MDFYESVTDILERNKDKIIGNSISKSIKNIQEIVDQLVSTAGMPNDIIDRYKIFDGDENLLYLADSYRDHFFHPFHTFLLGFLILSELKYSDKKIKSDFPDDDDFLKKWLLTSLTHDIAYTAEKGPEWLEGFIKKRLGINIRAYQDWGPIFSSSDNFSALNCLSNEFSSDKNKQLHFFTFMNKQIEKWHDHAILSAILLYSDAVKRDNVIVNWDNKNGIVKECSLAIALHNYHKAFSGDHDLIEHGQLEKDDSPSHKICQLSVKDFPLAFLLSYCDTAQEWGRPDSKQTANYNSYEGIAISDDKRVIINLGYDLNRYIEFKKQKGDNLGEDNAYRKLIEEELKKKKKMKNTWISINWEYNIKLVVNKNGNEEGTRTVRLTNPKKLTDINLE